LQPQPVQTVHYEMSDVHEPELSHGVFRRV
jgi:hypothetical protein